MDVELFENVGDAIFILRELNFKIIMVSNQTVVSRGILTYEEMINLNNHILDLILKQNPNAHFDELYFSPFHPNATIEAYRQDSECRKPRSGMFLKAAEKHSIDFKQSYVIGDRLTDIYAGKSLGCKGIHLLTGNENAKLIESNLDLDPKWLRPDYKFNCLIDAANFIKDLK